MRKTILLSLLFLLTWGEASADSVINLAGEWQFRMDRDAAYNDVIELPGSMPERLKGDDISVKTQWVGALYDSSYYHNPYMAKYRETGKMKLPFFLTPAKHYVGKAWYRKQFTVQSSECKVHSYKSAVRSKKQAEQNCELCTVNYELYIERPHISTEVWVNGKKVEYDDGKRSTHKGACNTLSVPHRWNLSGLLQEGENTIEICVDNDPEVAKVGNDSHSVTDQTQGCWNGMAGRIELRQLSPVRSMTVFPDVDRKEAKVLIRFAKCHSSLKEMELVAESFNTAKRHVVTAKTAVPRDADSLWVTLDMGDGMLLWDEHCPQMYRLGGDARQGVLRERQGNDAARQRGKLLFPEYGLSANRPGLMAEDNEDIQGVGTEPCALPQLLSAGGSIPCCRPRGTVYTARTPVMA